MIALPVQDKKKKTRISTWGICFNTTNVFIFITAMETHNLFWHEIMHKKTHRHKIFSLSILEIRKGCSRRWIDTHTKQIHTHINTIQ